jgi:hypothetical protein
MGHPTYGGGTEGRESEGMRSNHVGFFSRGVVLGILALAFAGCGGGGGGGGGNNPYAGTYQGEYMKSDGTMGVVGIGIDGSGSLNGLSEINSGTTTTLRGSVSSTGTITFSGGGDTFTGTMASSGGSTAAITATEGNTSLWIAMVNNPAKPMGTNTGFTGDYGGTIVSDSNNKVGVIAFKVATDGTLAGWTVVYDSGVPTFGTLAGSVGSTGAVTYTVTVNGAAFTTITGTWRINNGVIGGAALKDSSGQLYSIGATQLQ